MIAALVVAPAIAGVAAWFIRSNGARRGLMIVVAVAHAGLTAVAWVLRPPPAIDGNLQLDEPGLFFLSLTSVLFLFASFYAVGYLRREEMGERKDFLEGFIFTNYPEPVFTGCMLLFLATMTLIPMCHHLGLLWVAVEATTLASAPLVYFHRHHRSLEATWKYLLICSVGIALALLGNFFLAVAAPKRSGVHSALLLEGLIENGAHLHVPWLKAAFLFLLVGYGTKMGLAPLHTWLPDTHSEAPSVVSALLSGALLNCAFLGILRAHQVLIAAGLETFGQELLVGFGLISMGFAAIFVLGQGDYKRMLAYSSVEHMGILSLGVGLGGTAVFGAMLHAINHSLTKALLFFVAGNILAVYKTRSTHLVRGVGRVLPVSSVLWIAGFLAITGSPPFGAFLSEFTILKSALDQGRGGVAALYLIFLAIVFVGSFTVVLRMSQGEPSPRLGRAEESILVTFPPALLAIFVLTLGLYVPPELRRILHDVARSLGGS